MTPTTALEMAAFFYERRDALSLQARFDAAVALGEFGVLSARNISAIIDLPLAAVLKLVPKTEKTGGRLDPAALAPLLTMLHLRRRGEADLLVTAAALEGVSTYTAARLTGIPRSTLERAKRRAAEKVAA